MENSSLDFKKGIHTLSELSKETVCTIIMFIPNGIQGSILEINDNLNDAFMKTVNFVGLSHLDSDGFKINEANVIIVDHKVSISDLETIENFCKDKVIPLSMYMKYGDLESNSSCFMGKIIPVEKENN